MQFKSVSLAAIALSFSSFALAGPQCTNEPQSKWLPEATMKQKLADAGYTAKRFLTTKGNCYEIYGTDKTGKRVEIYFNPVDGSIVKQK